MTSSTKFSEFSVLASGFLLLGPTGAGKTPLGEALAREGLAGRRCFHFDFGANLRAVAEADHLPQLISEADREFVRDVLQSGALLERETFRIARDILLSFTAEHGVGQNDILVLNGLPRHVGQAQDVDRIVDITRVVFLECTAEVVHERIRLNSGGDRTVRADDSLEQIANKLVIFQNRTLPLLDHYRQKGVSITPVQVRETTTALEMVQQIARED